MAAPRDAAEFPTITNDPPFESGLFFSKSAPLRIGKGPDFHVGWRTYLEKTLVTTIWLAITETRQHCLNPATEGTSRSC